MRRAIVIGLIFIFGGVLQVAPACADEGNDWEITPESRLALTRGLEWLDHNRGKEYNWETRELGLVSLGLLAFLADGHLPGRGKYGDTTQGVLDYILKKQRKSGLFNITVARHDMYNHGLTTLVMGQVYGMTNDKRVGPALERALQLTVKAQCEDGGWHYPAKSLAKGADLSIAVMQTKSLRSAVDSGLKIPPEVRTMALRYVRAKHRGGSPKNKIGGRFIYADGEPGNPSVSMAAAGVVCLQEFGQYDDWRIAPNMRVVHQKVQGLYPTKVNSGQMPLDPYMLYYVSQALYQEGGDYWQKLYPKLRDNLVAGQFNCPKNLSKHGAWRNKGAWVIEPMPAKLFCTSTACYTLAIPNRYLPILQEGRIVGLKQGK